MRFRTLTVAGLALVAGLAAAAARGETLEEKVDPWVLETASRGTTEFLVMLRSKADLRGARTVSGKTAKRAFVVEALRAVAENAQAPMLAFLRQRGAPHRSFWIANMIWVRGDRPLVEALASRADVFRVFANPSVHLDEPVDTPPSAAPAAPQAIEWNVAKIHAPDVWALGFTGQGIVVAGADTGYQWDHPALKPQYRGWIGGSADHDYNWHDAIHSGGGSCGANATAPCDDSGHGTHTMGTMAGDDGGTNQIGVAPGARWIGCRNMDQGNGTPATYAECFEWFLAPTDLAGQNPDPSRAPDVISNSWSCPVSEGCSDPTVLLAVVESARLAGIEVVVSAGNAGSACGTINTPAAIYDAAFTVGATDINDAVAGFSSRGPVTVDGSNRPKPDVAAPGVTVRSSVPGGGYGTLSGTSMAAPNVAGLVALLLSANPDLVGDPDSIEPFITASAVAATVNPVQTCGGIPSTTIPNNTFGWGRVDALAAACLATPTPTGAQVDAGVNGVWEPGETVAFAPSYENYCAASLDLTGTASNLGGPAGAVYGIVDASASYGVVSQGVPASCLDTGNCYAVTVDDPVARPAAHWDATLDETLSNGRPARWTLHLGRSFADTPGPNAFYPFIENIFHNGVTGGCGGGNFCPAVAVARRQMAVFVLKAREGDTFAPPAASGVFADVPAGDPFAPWIEELYRRGVVDACGAGPIYCPNAPVLREQMAVFLLKTLLGSAYAPPACVGVFADTPCSNPFAPWVEDLVRRSIAAGCGAGNFCPGSSATRGQMAVFLVKTFGLRLYGP